MLGFLKTCTANFIVPENKRKVLFDKALNFKGKVNADIAQMQPIA